MTAPLPSVLREIAGVAGEPAAIALAAQVGGTRVYIPAKVGDNHWLVVCVGRKAADAICRHFAVDAGKRGVRIDVPLGGSGAYPQLRRAVARRVHQLEAERASSRAIAGTVGITQRSVHRRRRRERERKSGRQGQLF